MKELLARSSVEVCGESINNALNMMLETYKNNGK